MPGQFNTIRDETTGKLRKTTPEEVEKLKFSDIQSPPPAARVGEATQADADFIARNSGAEPPPIPPPVLPPPLPATAPESAQPATPPPLPAAPAEEEDSGAGAAASGVSAGSILGPIGAAAGGAAVFAASQSFQKHPIGTFEGSGQSGGGDQDVLRQLLEVQRTVARVGTPIKDAITTKSAGARL